MILPDYERQFPVLIDSTMRSDYSACPRKFFYRHILGLSPTVTSIHLVAGSAYARGLETARKLFYDEGVSPADAIAEGAAALIAEYGEDIDNDHPKRWDRVLEAYLSYFKQWPMESDYMHPHFHGDSHSVEFSFALPLQLDHPNTDDPLLYGGRFDMLAERQGALFVEDDKTTSSLGAQWSKQWALRSQFTGYCWGAKQFDYPVAGAVIRGTAILKTQINHAEAIVYRPEHIMDRWIKRLYEDIHDMRQHYIDDQWPCRGEESGACSAYGGCPYLQMCEASEPERWVTMFEISRWIPVQMEG